MTWSIVDEPAEEPITDAQFRAQCRILHDQEVDLIAAYITAARKYAEKWTGRQIITAGLKLQLDAFPIWEIRLPRPPLASVTSISYVDTNGDTQVIDEADYLVSTADEPGLVTPSYGGYWPSVRNQLNSVTILYQAGYGAAADVPKDLVQAIRLLAAHWYRNREAATDAPQTPLPLAVEALLDSFWTGEL